MEYDKFIEHYKVLTPTGAFAGQMVAAGASVLHARLAYSWLAYRSRLGRGASARGVCRATGLHPTTVRDALTGLGDLVERRGREWVAVEPPPGLFHNFPSDRPQKHWSDRLAYSVLYLPAKGAVIKYPDAAARFGLNHALIWSHLVRTAHRKGGVVKGVRMAGLAALYQLCVKTVRAVVNDLIHLKLVARVDLGSASDITPLPFTDQHRPLFRLKPEPKQGTPVEAVPRQPRPTPEPYLLRGDRWDCCRQLCDGLMPQERAEHVIAAAARIGEVPDDLVNEVVRLKAQHEANRRDGKVSRGNFGNYLVKCYDNRVAAVVEQEERERLERLLSSPEYQRKLATDQKAAEADPLHPLFIMSPDAVHARVRLDTDPVLNFQKYKKLDDRLYRHVKSFVAAKRLCLQKEMDEIGNVKGKILRHALAALNDYYRQPSLANQEQFERAIEAIATVEPGLMPLFMTEGGNA